MNYDNHPPAVSVPVFRPTFNEFKNFTKYIDKCITGGENWQPNMVLDDGGDATHLLIKKHPSVIKVPSFKVSGTLLQATCWHLVALSLYRLAPY